MYKVLLVDDEYMIPLGLKKVIDWKAEGFKVVATAESANEALSTMENQSIDLVITDVTMPEMNGLEFIEAAQEEQYEFEFVILSGYQEFAYLKSGMQLGAVNYLMKPVNKQELIDTLRSVKERLDQQSNQKNQQEVYQKTVLNQWLNEDLNEKGEEEVAQLLNHSSKWTVLLIQINRLRTLPLIKWLKDHKQHLFLQRNLGDITLFTIIYSGEYQDLLEFLKKVYSAEKWRVCVGKPNVDTEFIPISYQMAKDHLLLHHFYNHEEQVVYSENTQKGNQLIDMTEFHLLLQNNHIQMAEEYLDRLFDQINQLEIQPENVRQIAFLLFTDMQRKLLLLEDEEYTEVIEKINRAAHIHEIKRLLVQYLKRKREQFLYSENVWQAIQTIQDNYKRELTLKEVADQLFINTMYLGQLFKKETKKSFSQYLNHFRIEKAKQLLIETNKNINEISCTIGYNNTTYFSKKFKTVVGISPKDYRKKEQSKGEKNVNRSI